MKRNLVSVLILNSGSSSIKFAFYTTAKIPIRLLYGKIDRIGLKDSTLTFQNEKGDYQDSLKIEASDHRSATNFLIDWLEKHNEFSSIIAVGHRVVHGKEHTEPELITPKLLDELHSIISYDPNHLPDEIKLIESIGNLH